MDCASIFRNEIKTKLSTAELEDLKLFAERQNKISTGEAYRYSLLAFCKHYDTTPFRLINLVKLQEAGKLAEIEMTMETSQQFEFIRLQIKRHVEKLAEQYIEEFKIRNGKYVEGVNFAPKTLNQRICALKAYLVYKGVMDNPRHFKQIKFDKFSRATRDKALILFEQFKRMFDHADLREKLVIAFYGNFGVRPSLIPQLLIEDLKSRKDGYTALFINGIPERIELEQYQWIMVKKEYEGNKGHIDFPIVLTGEVAEWLSQHLNGRIRRGEKLTLQSQLIAVTSKRDVDYIVDKLFKAVGFEGRNYLLRHFANKRLKAAYEDKDFKEWCMGHVGDISSIYDHEHGLSHEEIKEYNASIDMSRLRIYGATSNEVKNANLMVSVARKLSHINESKLSEVLDLLERGKMTFEEFDQRLTTIIREAQDRAIEAKFDELMHNYKKKNDLSGH